MTVISIYVFAVLFKNEILSTWSINMKGYTKKMNVILHQTESVKLNQCFFLNWYIVPTSLIMCYIFSTV